MTIYSGSEVRTAEAVEKSEAGPREPELVPFDAAPPDTLANALGKRLDDLKSVVLFTCLV